MLQNPIVIVEDDIDDCELLVETLHELGVDHKLRCFKSGIEALEYLKQTTETPLIIISDINMPKMDGLELRRYIIEDTLLQKGKIPFVFLSTSTEYNLVETAFQLGIQGYFQKPNNYNSMRKVAHAIITYWANSSFIPAGNSFASPAARKSST